MFDEFDELLFQIAADLDFEVLAVEREELDGKERLTRDHLRGYQNRLIGLIQDCFREEDPLPGLLLALEPGAGKTGTVLTALRDMFDQQVINQALIVCPLLVAQTVWPLEIDEWEQTKNTTFTLLRVEDDDPELLAYSDRVYQRALARFQALFEAHVAREPVLKPTQARAAVRFRWKERAEKRRGEDDKSKLCHSPGELAGRIRDRYTLRFKYQKLARLAEEPTEIHIINKEALPWLWEHCKEVRRWRYEAIICDDLREGRSGKKRTIRGKTPDGQRPPLSRFGVLANARKKCKATIELTGTPTPKGLENVWGLAYLIDLGERLGTSKSKFIEEWFTVNQYSREVEANPGAFDEIMEKVRDIMFSIDPDEIGQLPDFVLDPIHVRMPRAVQEEYRRFERQMVSEAYDVEAVNSGVLHNKLLQFANGSMYQENGDDVWIHDCKIEALRELITRLEGAPLLCAYTYEFDVERICKAFPFARVLRPENAVETNRLWNKDKIQLLLAHRASAGHGLNMQKGTGHLCEYGLTTDVELYKQFVKRLHRPGRKSTVFNHVLISEGTIDERVYPLYLNPRQEMQNKILEAIRLTP